MEMLRGNHWKAIGGSNIRTKGSVGASQEEHGAPFIGLGVVSGAFTEMCF